jgi:hypothetical protein
MYAQGEEMVVSTSPMLELAKVTFRLSILAKKQVCKKLPTYVPIATTTVVVALLS